MSPMLLLTKYLLIRNLARSFLQPRQRYDPVSDEWTLSSANTSIARMPLARAGTGPAVYSHGHYFVFGGETLTNPDGAALPDTNVFQRVDVYNPANNSWTAGPDMPVAKHGIAPAATPAGIVVAGGGTTSGRSKSNSVHLLRVDYLL